MDSPIKVQLTPLIIRVLPFTVNEQADENIFPKSSYGWYGRMLYGKNNAMYILQKIHEDDRLWLIILNTENGEIYEKHMIYPYEGGVLVLRTHNDIRQQWRLYLAPENTGVVIQSIFQILDEPALSWSELSHLTEGMKCSPIIRGETIRDSLKALVPTVFPEQIREQIMAFLVWTLKYNKPNIDTVEYIHKILPIPFYKSLIAIHFHFLAKEKSAPQYVKLMNLSSTIQHRLSSRLLEETLEQQPHNRLHFKLGEIIPENQAEAIKFAMNLVQIKEVQTMLPISKEVALKSRDALNSRLLMMNHGLYLRADVRPSSLGLATLVYVGAAYRWVHNKLFWSARLGAIADRPSHLQVMVMPFASAERVRRLIPKVVDIIWSARTSNLGLYSEKTEKWTIPERKILTSANKSCSLSKLRKEFGF